MDKTFNSIIDDFKKFPEVKGIALGGSRKANTADEKSDIDVYIFLDECLSVAKRLELVKKYSSRYEVGGEYFGPGDEFYVDNISQQLDVMYMERSWIESIIENIWEKHYPANGYTTCFLFTLKNCSLLYDKENWLEGIKKKLDTPYPEELKKNIIKRNIMLLKDKPFASYYEQIEKALERGDINSVNHRIAAFMASYFDIIFAMNELLHPGEKKLVNYALEHCKKLPEDFSKNIERLLTQPNPDTLKILDDMVWKLKNSLKSLNYID